MNLQPLTFLRPHRMPALVSAIAACLVYSVTLFGTYVYDDIAIVQNDSRVHQPRLWAQLWTNDYFNGGVDNLYRPIVSSSYAIEWFIHGNRPWIFHAVNIVLHALVCAMVAEFTRRALGGSPVANTTALCAGLLFAVHPIHVEAVANIVGRAELACAAGIFGGLVILCRRPLTFGRVIAAFACAIVALFSKEQGLLQPLLWFFFFVLVWPKLRLAQFSRANSSSPAYAASAGETRPIRPSRRERQALKILVLLICWTWASYIIAREHFLKFEWDRGFVDPTVQPMLKSVGMDRVLMPVALLGRYSVLLLWPTSLSPDYSADVIGSVVYRNDPYLWIGFTALIAWLAIAFWSWLTAKRFVLFCLLALAASYGLIGNIVTLIGTIFAERLAYLPSAFFVMLPAVPIARLKPRLRCIVLIVLVTAGSIRTFTAARQWNHPMVLFQSALSTHPKSLQLRFLIAQEYEAKHDEADADAILADAARIYPNNWSVWMRRADQAMDAGQLDKAQQYLDHAIQLEHNPNLIAVEARLANLREAKKRKELEPRMMEK